ncbi:MAG: carotenoid biosynthesis protein [Candidatus Neomarinimicrobiota bacterium]|nr:MAG: carotenoid biosynthesis protein [Candidatus Neomarinimicrobiota bacterium]
MWDIWFSGVLILLILSVIFGYRFLEHRVGYRAAERLRIGQMAAFLILFSVHGGTLLGGSVFAGLLGTAFAGTLLIEWTGVRWGWFFGRYRYTDTACILPAVGGVPLCYPIAWAGLIYAGFWTSLLWLPPSGGVVHLSVPFIGLTALEVTVLDFILDPIAVDEGRWVWQRQGRYYGVPWTNFAGWFSTVVVILLAVRWEMGSRLAIHTPSHWALIYPGLGYGLLAAITVRVCRERQLKIPAWLGGATALLTLGRIVWLQILP